MSASFPANWGRFVRYIKGGRPFGRDGHIRVSYFLDLLSAAHFEGELDKLAELLSALINKDGQIQDCAAVVCPKRGNVLLLNAVGRKLGMRTAFVRDSILFSNWVEGDLRLGNRVVLIDDIASDGEMLRDAVSNLRTIGIYVPAVYVLVDRREGDAEKVLREEGVIYKYVYRMSDEDLANLKDTP